LRFGGISIHQANPLPGIGTVRHTQGKDLSEYTSQGYSKNFHCWQEFVYNDEGQQWAHWTGKKPEAYIKDLSSATFVVLWSLFHVLSHWMLETAYLFL